MNNTDNQLIATRYAKSLIGLAAQGGLDYTKLYQNLQNVKEILSLTNELFDALCNPVISANDKEELISCIFANDTDETMRNFLKLLVRENRFNLIYEIIKIYDNMLDKINNVSKVEVLSAIELDDNFKEQIKNKLAEILKKEIIVNYNTDKSIIAGLVYKMGDDIFDTSLRGKFDKFKKAILK